MEVDQIFAWYILFILYHHLSSFIIEYLTLQYN